MNTDIQKLFLSITAIIFFTLGAYCYQHLPEDYNPTSALPVAPQSIIDVQNGCYTIVSQLNYKVVCH